MSSNSSPSQTPTTARMRPPPSGALTVQRPSSGGTSPRHRPSPLSSGAVTPDTATFANAKRGSGPPTPGSTTPIPDVANRVNPPTRGATKARDLLRQHYGLGVGPPVPAPGRSTDPMDVDSPAFDAKAYYEQLITTSTLTTLLKRENELSAEIRELDGERQALVYNHHHELVNASDTIRAMKSRAEGLDSDLEKLRAAFSEISRLSAEVTLDNVTKVADE